MVQTSPATTPNLGLVVIEISATGQAARVNAANNVLDMLVGKRVLGITNTPPAHASGEVYIVGQSPTGAWATKAGWLAGSYNSAWVFIQPKPGWEFYVNDEKLPYRAITGTTWGPSDTAQVRPWATKTASFTPSATEAAHYWVDATSGNISVTMPAPGSNVGRTWLFKRKDSSGNTVTFLPAASELVEGAASLAGIASQNNVIRLSCDGTNWAVV